MPSEVSIAKHLSGTECLYSCVEALKKALSKDDRFSSHMAYSGFRAEVSIKFYPVMSFIPPVDRTVTVEEGDLTELEYAMGVDTGSGESFESTVVLEPAPPNAVREEAGLPQPVLVTDNEGKSHEKWVTKGPVPRQNRIPGKLKVLGAS